MLARHEGLRVLQLVERIALQEVYRLCYRLLHQSSVGPFSRGSGDAIVSEGIGSDQLEGASLSLQLGNEARKEAHLGMKINSQV